MKKAALAFAMSVLSLQASCASGPPPDDGPPRQNCHAVTRATCDLAHKLGRGVNLGNMLDSPREGDWGVRLEPELLRMAASHFTTVRVPVRWSNHAAPTADATIDEKFARRVDEAVDGLLARGAYVILNVHHYNQLSGANLHRHEFAVDPAVMEERLVNLWRQIAHRYQNRSSRLVFELLNEPHDRLDGEPWNELAARALAAVRETNPQRAVMIGPGFWNNANALSKLRLPADRNLIVAVHNYTPFNFTHQGVTYRPNPFPAGTPCCDAGQRQAITDTLDVARGWNRIHGYPVHLGEFGAFHAADMRSRETYTRLVRDEAERRGFGWTYWEFASEYSGVYVPAKRAWVEPIRRALLD